MHLLYFLVSQVLFLQTKQLPDWSIMHPAEIEVDISKVLQVAESAIDTISNLPSASSKLNYSNTFEAFEKGETGQAQELQAAILYLSEQLYQNETYSSSYLKGLKAAMSFEGLCQGNLALPLYAYSEEEKTQLFEKYRLVKERIGRLGNGE